MSVQVFFGLPGSGKTTLVAKRCVDTAAAIVTGRSKYRYVYTNVEINNPFVRTIPFDFIGRYDIRDSLIVIDEASLFVDNRDYKTFPEHLKKFILLHRHFGCDILFFAQQWDALDKKIRAVTEKVFYLKKGVIFRNRTKVYPLIYGVYIPQQTSDKSGSYGDISMGYKMPGLLTRLLAPSFNRKRYYRYFDSWDSYDLPPVPGFDLVASSLPEQQLSDPAPIDPDLQDDFTSLED